MTVGRKHVGSAVNVAYVVGCGRSGSTLLGTILGNHSKVFDGGEIRNFGEFFRTSSHERFCACGQELQKCDFWGRVRVLVEKETGSPNPTLKSNENRSFVHCNSSVMKACLSVSSSDVFLDSSKRLPRLLALKRNDEFSVKTIHLIRDPRAYVASQLERGKPGQMRLAVPRLAIRWVTKNVWLKIRFAADSTVVVLKYEDLIRDLPRACTLLLKHLELEQEDLTEDQRGQAHHDFSGNKKQRLSRSRKVVIDLDKNASASLSVLQRLIVNSLTFWTVPIFRYPIW